MNIRIFAFVALVMASVVTLVPAQTASAADEATLKGIEQKWDAAAVKGDATALGALFADSVVSTNAEGKVRTKAMLLAEVTSGAVKYLNSKVDDMKVSVYGDTAVVNGRWAGTFVEHGKTIDTVERFTDTFIKQNGQWKCIASHGSTIKP